MPLHFSSCQFCSMTSAAFEGIADVSGEDLVEAFSIGVCRFFVVTLVVDCCVADAGMSNFDGPPNVGIACAAFFSFTEGLLILDCSSIFWTFLTGKTLTIFGLLATFVFSV